MNMVRHQAVGRTPDPEEESGVRERFAKVGVKVRPEPTGRTLIDGVNPMDRRETPVK